MWAADSRALLTLVSYEFLVGCGFFVGHGFLVGHGFFVGHGFSRDNKIRAIAAALAAAAQAKYYLFLVCSPIELFPAAISLSRAICVQVRRRTGDNPTSPRRASSSAKTGGNPAVPSSEFTSARFSARSRAVSSSSSNTYRDRTSLKIHSIII